MKERDFNAIVESRLEEEVETLIHGIRADVREELTPMYISEFKKLTGLDVTYGEEGWGELPDGAEWTEELIEESREAELRMQDEFDLRVRERIRDYKSGRVEDLRQEVREELQVA